MKILIALDASNHSERALEFVTRMRWPAGSRVIVTSVWQPSVSALATGMDASPVLAEIVDAERKQLHVMLADAERRLHEAGLPTEVRMVEGDPRERLVEAARNERADLVVMGSHGRAGLAKLMIGSVSSHLVTHAPCSVLVVKRGSDGPHGHATGDKEAAS